MTDARRHTRADYPSWVREIDHTLSVTPQYLVTGNIRDTHLLPADDPRGPDLMPTIDVLTDILRENGFRAVIGYDIVDGFTVLHESEPGDAGQVIQNLTAGRALPATTAALREALRDVAANRRGRVGLVVDYASRLRRDDTESTPELHDLLVAAEKLAYTSRAMQGTPTRPVGTHNTVIWMLDRESDLPHWLAASDTVRVVSVPRPTLTVRETAGPRLISTLLEFPSDPDRARSFYKRFAELTHGMTLRSMRDVVTLATEGQIPVTRIDEAVRAYRIGIVDNPWTQASVLDAIRGGADTLSRSVLGQPSAVRKSLDILMRSAVGLTGAHSGGSPGRPQGILFFAGPTGVGKTELAKSLASLLFGTEDAYIRFDMSEFSAEHSEARLIGAPPGYIGHDAGGELTNAVRQQPFSILLFDEIEKAHPRILDKFLQILEDGRLTDGSGSTVYFSETVIVFTSNLGIYRETPAGREPIVRPGEQDYETLVTRVRSAIEADFTSRLGRRELLNRLGDNIVVFDFIAPEIGRKLVDKYLRNVVDRVARQRGIHVTVDDAVRDTIAGVALHSDTLAFGGRGIGSVVESMFINPLARALFEADTQPGAITVTALTKADDGWRVSLA